MKTTAHGERLTDDQLEPARVDRLRQRVYQVFELRVPGDHLSRVIDTALVALIVLNVAAVLAESVEPVRLRYGAAFLTFELVSVIGFSLEYAARVWAASEQPRFSGIQNPVLRRLRYMLTPMALVDLAAVLPFYLVSLGLVGGLDMRFLRSLRLVRIFKLSRYSQAMTLLLQVLNENARIFAAAFGVLLIVMIIAASGIHIFERAAQPDAFGSIPAAMWWAFATLTTVGYGDVYPITVGGKVFGAVVTVVSVGMVALPAGILASSFSERLRLRSSSYRDMADRAYADGILTTEEFAELEAERVELGIGEDLAAAILDDEQSKHANQSRCPTCGQDVESRAEDRRNLVEM